MFQSSFKICAKKFETPVFFFFFVLIKNTKFESEKVRIEMGAWGKGTVGARGQGRGCIALHSLLRCGQTYGNSQVPPIHNHLFKFLALCIYCLKEALIISNKQLLSYLITIKLCTIHMVQRKRQLLLTPPGAQNFSVIGQIPFYSEITIKTNGNFFFS